jgi:diguanylate cyclase (GGDEF)-like protein
VELISSTPKKTWSFAAIKEKALKTFQNNNSVLDECAQTNTRRIYYLSMIAIPLRIINIFLFAFTQSYDTPAAKIWIQGIVSSHLILLVIMVGFFLTTRTLKSRVETNTTMVVLQYIVVVVIMASGIAIVTFDQLATTNITPFLLTCIVIGLVFFIRPLVSFLIYVVSYMAYYGAIGLTATNQQILLSNRVNGITAIGIGFLLSNIMWHYNYTDITQKRRIKIQQMQLEQMAYYDPLTDLPNRRLLEQVIQREFTSMKRYGHETVIIILDLDNFKSINDTYGHPAGDKILRQLAELLKNNVRESDTVFRFGGEEFIILMPNTSVEGGYAFAERLRKAIMKHRFSIRSVALQITSSFGVSSIRNVHGQTLEDCYLLADQALYLAKQSGKNKVKTACGMTEEKDEMQTSP